MKKHNSLLEDYIQKLYSKLNIYYPHQLNIETISTRLGLVVFYIPHKPMYIAGKVFLDNRCLQQEQWQSFGHELCHALWHIGNQSLIPKLYRDYQENTANNFAQHACIPSFMLYQMDLPRNEKKAIWLLQETFHVDYEFAKKRLGQYLASQKLYGVQS
ncbi:MAG: ImmA/IrrE family metallo-endopeptidase [Paenisporosarcina sp.]